MPPPDLNLVTEKIIGCAYRVSNSLGIGFVEKVYQNALAHEIQKIWSQNRSTSTDQSPL